MPNKFKKFISILLSLNIIISTPLLSLAGDIGGSAGGSNAGGVTTVSGGDFGVNRPSGRIGIRLSLIDRNEPSKVISVDESGNPMVVDIMYVDKSTYEGFTNGGYLTALNDNYRYSAVKTQSIDQHNKIIRIYYDQLTSSLGTEMPSWAIYENSKYVSQGVEFVDWCKRDENGNISQNIQQGGGLVFTYTTSSGKKIQVSATDEGSVTSNNGGADAGVNLSESYTKDYNSMHSFLQKNKDKLLHGPIDKEQIYAMYVMYIRLMKASGRINDSEHDSLIQELDDMLSASGGGGGTITGSSKTDKINWLASITNRFKPLDINAQQLNTGIHGGSQDNTQPENQGETVSGTAWIVKLLQLKGNNGFLLQTPSMREGKAESLDKATEDWLLLVEPIVYLTIFQPGDDHNYVLPKQYGTISNIAEAINRYLGNTSHGTKAKWGTFNWKALNGPLWGALHVDDAGFTFGNGDKLLPCGDYGSWVSMNDLAARNQWQNLSDGTKGKYGYGVNVYWLKQQSKTITWDEPNFPDGYPGPSPDCTPLPDESSYNENNKKFKIAKWYYIESPDGSQHVYDVQTRTDTPHVVDIVNEGDDTTEFFWEIEKWGTGIKDKIPNNGDISTTYEDYWNSNKGTYNDTKPVSGMTVKPEDPDKVLYVKLVMKIVEKPQQITVKKYFPDLPVKTEKIDPTPLYDSNEPGFTYVEDKQSPNLPVNAETWEEVPNEPSETNPYIPVKETTKTIYIKYEANEVGNSGVLVLHQNELAHTFTLEDLLPDLISVSHRFSDEYASGSGRHGSGSDVWYCDWERVINDDRYSYVVSNKENYGATTFVGSQGAFTPQEIGENNDTGTLGIHGGSTEGFRPNLKFSIYRDKAKDNVTLYTGKNNDGIKSELANIFITKEGYKPQTTRVTDKGQTEWYSNFKVNYTYDTEDNTLSWSKVGCSTHGGASSGSWNGVENPTLASLNSAYSGANNVLTRAYLGQPGKGDKISTIEAESFTIDGKTFNRNLKYKFTSGSGLIDKFDNDKSGEPRFFKFYPYTEMEYQTVTDLNNKLAYIVSTNLSEVKDNTSVEIGVYQSSNNGNTVDISSEQWSTHARTIQGLKDQNVNTNLVNKSLIPGGAVVKLSTANRDNSSPEVWVGFRSYEMAVSDDLKVTLSEENGVKTTSQAKADANAFFEDMKNNLGNYHLEKWIVEGIYTDENAIRERGKKVSGINTGGAAGSRVVTSFGGNQLSTDKKYYLKNNTSDATSSKFDVFNDKIEQHVYRVSADVYGKVTVTKDGAEIVSSNIKADKNLSGLLGNADVKRIDDRVKFVTNFVQSLDFEGGKDREAIPWYYEAHDGLEVVETLGIMQVGFDYKKEPIRSEVVDPKLTGKLENRDDTLNFNDATLEEKTRTVQYKMSSSPTTNTEVPGYVGKFNGESIIIPNISEILKTRLHYMGNNTVMDLN